MNYALLISPAGMISIGIIACWYWWRRANVDLKLFLWGGLLWAMTVFPKIAMDYTISSYFYGWLTLFGQGVAFAIAAGLYVGLRTGLLECLIPYCAFKSRLRGITSNQAIAVGIGFGAVEAIILAVPNLIQMSLFFVFPGLMNTLPADQLALLEEQLNQPTWLALVAISERVFTIMVHTFTALLAFYAVVTGASLFLAGAVLFKTLLDGALPYFQLVIGMATPSGIFLAEIFVAVMGLIGLLGIIKLRESLNIP